MRRCGNLKDFPISRVIRLLHDVQVVHIKVHVKYRAVLPYHRDQWLTIRNDIAGGTNPASLLVIGGKPEQSQEPGRAQQNGKEEERE